MNFGAIARHDGVSIVSAKQRKSQAGGVEGDRLGYIERSQYRNSALYPNSHLQALPCAGCRPVRVPLTVDRRGWCSEYKLVKAQIQPSAEFESRLPDGAGFEKSQLLVQGDAGGIFRID